MKEVNVWGYDTQGSFQAIRINPDGRILTALDTTDITLDTDLDTLAGTAIAVNSGEVTSGTLRVVHATDVATSTSATGNIAHDSPDSGNPIKIGGIARTANPTAVANLDRVDASFDKVGRQITYPYSVRDLVGTAVATLTTNAADNETTLLTGVAAELHDLIYVSAANSSTNAVRIIFRDGTGGADLFDISIAANSTQDINFQVPWKQSQADMSWRVDFGINANIADPNDVTNTTVKVMAQYITNV